MSAGVQQQLSAAETQLKAALKAKDKDRPSTMKKVLTLLDQARAALFTATPPDPGTGGSGGTSSGGGGPIEGGESSGGTVSSGGSGIAGTAPIPAGRPGF